MLQSLLKEISIGTYFAIKMCALFFQKKIQHFLQKNVFFLKENMILVGSWKVELVFKVLAPTSMYEFTMCGIFLTFASPFSGKANDQDIEPEVLADFGLSLGPGLCSVRVAGQQAVQVTN